MHLTALSTICSIRVWKITRKPLWNLTNVLRRKKVVVDTSINFGGQKDFVAPDAVITQLGPKIMTFINANNVVTGFRLSPVLSFRIPASLCDCGSEQFGTSQVKSMASALWGCRECWGWAVIGQLGPGCTNCDVLWSGLDEIDFRVWSR